MGLFDSISYHRLAQCIADDCQRYTDNLTAYGSCDEPPNMTGASDVGGSIKANDQKNQFYALSLGAMDWTYITPREADDYFRPHAYTLGRKSRFYSDYGFDMVDGNSKLQGKKLIHLAKMVTSFLGDGYCSFLHYTTSSGAGTGFSDTFQVYSNHQYTDKISVSGGFGSSGRCYAVICKASEYEKLKENALSSVRDVLKAEKKIGL